MAQDTQRQQDIDCGRPPPRPRLAAAQPAPDRPAPTTGHADCSAPISRPPTCSAASSRKTRASSCSPSWTSALRRAPRGSPSTGLVEQLSLRSERQRPRGRRSQRVVRTGFLRVGDLPGRQGEAGRALHLLHQSERRVHHRPGARDGPRLRRQRQHGPAESQGDPRVRARRPGRRRQRQGDAISSSASGRSSPSPLTTNIR